MWQLFQELGEREREREDLKRSVAPLRAREFRISVCKKNVNRHATETQTLKTHVGTSPDRIAEPLLRI
jgi:hypothetical protein